MYTCTCPLMEKYLEGIVIYICFHIHELYKDIHIYDIYNTNFRFYVLSAPPFHPFNALSLRTQRRINLFPRTHLHTRTNIRTFASCRGESRVQLRSASLKKQLSLFFYIPSRRQLRICVQANERHVTHLGASRRRINNIKAFELNHWVCRIQTVYTMKVCGVFLS